MPRPFVVTRSAGPDDLPVLLTLWDELRALGGRAERAINPLASIDVRERLVEVLADPTCRVVMACAENQPAGMAVLSVTRPDPLSDCEFVQIAHLVVSREKQHRGVGHALINAASDFAAERHIEHVTTGVYPSLREANRFYARLGFAPLSVRRIAPVSALRRRAAADRSMPLVADSLRRRARIVRQLPPQRVRPAAVERVDS